MGMLPFLVLILAFAAYVYFKKQGAVWGFKACRSRFPWARKEGGERGFGQSQADVLFMSFFNGREAGGGGRGGCGGLVFFFISELNVTPNPGFTSR